MRYMLQDFGYRTIMLLIVEGPAVRMVAASRQPGPHTLKICVTAPWKACPDDLEGNYSLSSYQERLHVLRGYPTYPPFGYPKYTLPVLLFTGKGIPADFRFEIPRFILPGLHIAADFLVKRSFCSPEHSLCYWGTPRPSQCPEFWNRP